MSMRDLHEALHLIEEHPADADFEGAKPEELVAVAERALGIGFPPSYRGFLRSLGCGDFRGEEFYGLVDSDFEASSVPDVVWFTLRQRESSNLPQRLIPFYATGDGTYFALDASSDGSEYPVVEWKPGAQAAVGPVAAEDFGAFFLQRISAALQ